jgi:hypothetical protein
MKSKEQEQEEELTALAASGRAVVNVPAPVPSPEAILQFVEDHRSLIDLVQLVDMNDGWRETYMLRKMSGSSAFIALAERIQDFTKRVYPLLPLEFGSELIDLGSAIAKWGVDYHEEITDEYLAQTAARHEFLGALAKLRDKK